MNAFTGVAATEDFYDAQSSLALYDFRNPTKLGREKVRRLELMHETFERAMSARLGSLLRTMVRVEALAVDTLGQKPRANGWYDLRLTSRSPALIDAPDQKQISVLVADVDR